MRIFLFMFLVFTVKAADKVKISVYYETLCPDSIAFINNQLFPNYVAFGTDVIDLELIPYGFANETDSNGTKSFTCQHGKDECYGNKVHGCVLNTTSIIISVAFIHCSENSKSPTSETVFKQCAQVVNISWSDINTCLYVTLLADQIMSENGKKTRILNPKFVPAIVFNEKFNQDDQNNSIDNLQGVICKYLDYKPIQCNQKRYVDVLVL